MSSDNFNNQTIKTLALYVKHSLRELCTCGLVSPPTDGSIKRIGVRTKPVMDLAYDCLVHGSIARALDKKN